MVLYQTHDPPASTSPSAGIAGVCHHALLSYAAFDIRYDFNLRLSAS
jgi:hypothetical protein